MDTCDKIKLDCRAKIITKYLFGYMAASQISNISDICTEIRRKLCIFAGNDIVWLGRETILKTMLKTIEEDAAIGREIKRRD